MTPRLRLYRDWISRMSTDQVPGRPAAISPVREPVACESPLPARGNRSRLGHRRAGLGLEQQLLAHRHDPLEFLLAVRQLEDDARGKVRADELVERLRPTAEIVAVARVVRDVPNIYRVEIGIPVAALV